MNKKIMIFIVIGIVFFGGLIGFMLYRNSPGYVMKQYVNAINHKDQKKLEKIIYTANQFKIRNIEDLSGGLVDEIVSYSITENPTGDKQRIEDFKIIHFKYPEKIDATISKVATYEIYNKSDWHDWISLACVNGRWKIVVCPLLIYEDAS